MADSATDYEVTFEFITPEQQWEIFDRAAQRRLGVSGRQFADWWDAGTIEDHGLDDTEITGVAMLRPSGF